jgi:hypothetical protein
MSQNIDKIITEMLQIPTGEDSLLGEVTRSVLNHYVKQMAKEIGRNSEGNVKDLDRVFTVRDRWVKIIEKDADKKGLNQNERTLATLLMLSSIVKINSNRI